MIACSSVHISTCGLCDWQAVSANVSMFSVNLDGYMVDKGNECVEQ